LELDLLNAVFKEERLQSAVVPPGKQLLVNPVPSNEIVSD
jgi:hypothetical protein